MTSLFKALHLIRSENAAAAMQPHQLVARGQEELLGSDRSGFIAMGVIALVSFVSSFSLLAFLTFRFIFWQRYYKRPLAENQYVVLIYNLLLVDLQQASAFLICLHWLTRGNVNYPSPACVLQGWWIQIADPGSGLFVLAIAIHTAGVVLRGRQLEYRNFVYCVIALWGFIILLGLIPVGMFTSNTFVISEAGWVSFYGVPMDKFVVILTLFMFSAGCPRLMKRSAFGSTTFGFSLQNSEPSCSMPPCSSTCVAECNRLRRCGNSTRRT